MKNITPTLAKLSLNFLVTSLLLFSGSALASTPDGQTPAEESICDGLEGRLFGICNAYCEAQDCDSDNGNKKSCDRLESKFFDYSGGQPLPCITSASILVEKYVNGQDPASPADLELIAGENEMVTFTYVVKNNGTETLSNVQVSDNPAPMGGISCMPSQPAILAMGEQMLCEATDSVLVGLFENTVTATGDANGGMVQASDTSGYFGLTADIKITKLVGLVGGQFEDANTMQDALQVDEFDELEYVIVIENLGDATLTDIMVTDNDVMLDCSDVPMELAPGSGPMPVCSSEIIIAELGTHMNMASVTAITDPGGKEVSDGDPAYYTGSDVMPPATCPCDFGPISKIFTNNATCEIINNNDTMSIRLSETDSFIIETCDSSLDNECKSGEVNALTCFANNNGVTQTEFLSSDEAAACQQKIRDAAAVILPFGIVQCTGDSLPF